MNRSTPERLRYGRSRRPYFIALAVVSASALGIAWRAVLRPDPERLVRQANSCAAADPAEAERLLRQAISLAGGSHPKAAMALCRLLAGRGDWETASPLLAALDQGACPSAFLIEMGEAALRAGRTGEGVALLELVRRRKDRDAAAALEHLFAHYHEQQQDRQMLDCLHELAERDGQPALWWKLLELLDARDLETEFLFVLREALQQPLPAADRLELRHRLVARLVDLGETKQARSELDSIVEREGLSPRARLHQAAILRLEGKPREALKALEAALSQSGEHPGAVRLRALIHLDLDMLREATADFQQGLENDPFDLSAHYKLAELYRKLGETELAQKHLEISTAIREKRQRINKLREASKRDPPDRRLYDELARLHRELNDARGALFWEERASRLRDDGSARSQPHESSRPEMH